MVKLRSCCRSVSLITLNIYKARFIWSKLARVQGSPTCQSYPGRESNSSPVSFQNLVNRFSGWKGHPSNPSSRANFTLALPVCELYQGETIRACASALGSGKWVNVFLIWTFTKIYSAWSVWSSFRDNLVSI